MKVKSLSRVLLLATPWTAAYQAPLSMESDFPGKSTGVGKRILSGERGYPFPKHWLLGSLYFLRYSVASEEVGVSLNFCASDMTC